MANQSRRSTLSLGDRDQLDNSTARKSLWRSCGQDGPLSRASRLGRSLAAAALSALVLAGLLAAPVAAQPAPPAGQPGPDGLAHLCLALRSSLTGDHLVATGDRFTATAAPQAAERFRFQATDLARYLLVDRDDRHLAADGSAVGSSATASPDADWLVEAHDGAFALRLPSRGRTLVAEDDGTLRLVAGAPDGAAARFELVETDGCTSFPEVELNVSGPHHVGPNAAGEVVGYVDAHLHVTAFEFLGGRVHCGRPWHRYGVTHALVDCPDHEIADGAGALLENLLSSGAPVGQHDPLGWPTFRDWPAPGSLTHEQTYYRWLERAWRGGLRVLVNLLVENRVLCEVYPLKQNPCDEMESIRLQVQRLRELERYIDAQSGGAGQGWFRIVDNPADARAVVNEGKLAVLLGIEISEPFGCRILLGVPQCSEADIETQLDEVAALGVMQITPIHKFDNAFGGVAGDGGTKGLIINGGNLLSTGSFWDFVTCDAEDTGVHDNDQEILPGTAEHTALFGGILELFSPVALPIYPEPHHCNTKGLTALGAHTIEAMVERCMVVDVDHMSVAARQQALDLLEDAAYPGVISSHSWATPDAYPRIYELGGMTTPYAGGSTGFVRQWEERRAAAGDPEEFGIGFGADSNGLGAQGGPRGADAENPVEYPFTGLGGVVIDKQVSGKRVYDINVDGVAHYGLYPDWVEDLRRQAGDQIVADLARGAETYLSMWESAIAASGCAAAAPFDPGSPAAPVAPGGPAAPGPAVDGDRLPATGAGSTVLPLAAAGLLLGLVLGVLGRLDERGPATDRPRPRRIDVAPPTVPSPPPRRGAARGRAGRGGVQRR